MSKDQGRTVNHFGRWYLWSLNEAGALSLISVDRFNEQIRAVRDALRTGRSSTDQPATP